MRIEPEIYVPVAATPRNADPPLATFPGQPSAAFLDLPLLLGINVVLYALAILWVGPATADVHDLAGPNLRGLAIGIFFSSVNIVAYGIGSPVIGCTNPSTAACRA